MIRVEDKYFEFLTRLQVGGCTCMTKTPEISYHDPKCRYRLAVELEKFLQSIAKTL